MLRVELPTRPPDVRGHGPQHPAHYGLPRPGCFLVVNFGNVHYWTWPVHPPRVCYSSGLDGEWNESSHGYVNTSAVDLVLFEGDPWPDVRPLQLVTRRQLGGPPGVKRRPQCCPTGWNNARAASTAQRCSGEAGPSCVAEPALLFPAPPPGLAWVGYHLLLLVC